MTRKNRRWLSALVLVPCLVLAADLAPLEALRKKHPCGVPWSIEFTDESGRSLGRLDVLITDRPARSCLGSVGPDAVRVAYLDFDGPIRRIVTSPYGVAKISGTKVEIDLTGDMCDAYVLMRGQMLADGSSTGEVYTLGISSGETLAAFHATVR
jgi:hypothetical protein